jgi:hypothetical protein
MKSERDAFDLYFRRQNDARDDTGIYLEVIRWEHFLDAMSETRLQDEYNRAVRECDVFVCLFGTKAGRFTIEEFKVAQEAFTAKGHPLIYTYFCETPLTTGTANRDDLRSLWDFEDQLKSLEHYPTWCKNIDGLKLHFKEQLEKLRREGTL